MMEFQNDLEQLEIESLLKNTKKQHILINFLEKHSATDITGLAYLIGIPLEKLRAVQNSQDYLNQNESKKLMDYFFIWYGS